MSVAASVLISAGQDPVRSPWTYPDILQDVGLWGTLSHVKYGFEVIFVVRQCVNLYVAGYSRAKQGQYLLHGIPSNNLTQIPHRVWEWGLQMEQINEQVFSAFPIKNRLLKNKNSTANFFFGMLIIISFNLPPGFRALGFQFYSFSSGIYYTSSRTEDFVIFISVEDFYPEEKYQIH